MGTHNYMIPYNVPLAPPKSIQYIQQVLNSSHHSGDGPFADLCCNKIEKVIGCRKALLTPSCTHALEMAAILLDIQPGDEVILPSFTFVSTANAFVLRGAIPVFVDIRPDTLNIDESLIEAAIGPRTKAIIVVHYAGIACEMDVIMKISERHAIPVVEDNAHGLFGSYNGKLLGSFGVLATQSFHETKNISSGEGGALLINDESLVQRAEIIREKGTNRTGFFRGEAQKYGWLDIGSSWLPSEITAALLFSYLEVSEEIQQTRKKIWLHYYNSVNEWALDNSVGLPAIPDGCDPAWHLFYLVMPSQKKRDELIAYLNKNGIKAVFHYMPLHASEYILNTQDNLKKLPVTESICVRLVRLPLYNSMAEDDFVYVSEKVCAFKCV